VGREFRIIPRDLEVFLYSHATPVACAPGAVPDATNGSVRGGGGNSGFDRGVGLGWPSDLAARVELRSSHP
jgi:hypothetical protein